MSKPVVPMLLMAAGLLTASISYADKAWDQYLGLNPAQKNQLKTDEKAKAGSVKPAQQDKESSTQNLMAQVLANAGDSTLQPILNQILSDNKTINATEDLFWTSVGAFLTPTQVAKLYLKGHHPKNQTPSPQMSAPKPTNSQPLYNWNAYFGFSKEVQAQLKAADQNRNGQMKTAREERDAALVQLNQLVQSNAADPAILGVLKTIFSDEKNEHATEQAFWETTLPGFLNPTQMAKLYLHRHASKGGFNPPPPAPVASR